MTFGIDEMPSVVMLSASVIFLIIVSISVFFGRSHVELPERRTGRLGEEFATTVISEILRDEDVLMSNVPIFASGQEAELDNVVINKRGLFVIEVKNWGGQVLGSEDDEEWLANNGAITVKNPILQVKRQTAILSDLLTQNRIDAPVKGYVFFVNQNSQVESDHILRTRNDMDAAIHDESGDVLAEWIVERIAQLLEEQAS